MGQDGFVQGHFEDGARHLEMDGFAVLLQPTDVVVADFIGLQLGDAVAHAGVGVGDGPRAHVHHAAGLEGIEIEVVEHPPEGVG